MNHLVSKKERELLAQAMMDFPQISGAFMGLVEGKDGRRENRVVLQLAVRQKLPKAEVSSDDLLPETYKGYEVQVVQRDPKRALAPQGVQNPHRSDILKPGISIGTEGRTGTLGLIVRKGDKFYGLTNFHVAPVLDAPVFQPGPADVPAAGVPMRQVGSVGFNTISSLDMALLEFPSNALWNNVPVGLNKSLRGHKAPLVGKIYSKVGRTTGFTTAQCVGMGFIRINYGTGIGTRSIYTAELAPQNLENPSNVEISEPGDSGSGWFDPDTMEFVALHCAGESSGDPDKERAYGCPADAVMSVYGTEVAEGGTDSGSDYVPAVMAALGLAKTFIADSRAALDGVESRINDVISAIRNQ